MSEEPDGLSIIRKTRDELRRRDAANAENAGKIVSLYDSASKALGKLKTTDGKPIKFSVHNRGTSQAMVQCVVPESETITYRIYFDPRPAFALIKLGTISQGSRQWGSTCPESMFETFVSEILKYADLDTVDLEDKP